MWSDESPRNAISTDAEIPATGKFRKSSQACSLNRLKAGNLQSCSQGQKALQIPAAGPTESLVLVQGFTQRGIEGVIYKNWGIRETDWGQGQACGVSLDAKTKGQEQRTRVSSAPQLDSVTDTSDAWRWAGRFPVTLQRPPPLL